MVSDFVDELNGPLKLSEEKYIQHKAQYPDLVQEARVLLECGENRDGHWDNTRFMANVKVAAAIAEIKYIEAQYDILWIFGYAPSHRKMAADALNAQRRSVRPGGKQPILRDTVYSDKNGVAHEQKMYFVKGGGNVGQRNEDGARRARDQHSGTFTGEDGRAVVTAARFCQ